MLTTPRLVLRPFTDGDRAGFFELNTHPLVVSSLGSMPTRPESDAMIERFSAELEREGWGLWAIEVAPTAAGGGAPFAGMVGLHRVNPALPCAPAVEVGWRLHPDHWGRGYATEGARAALHHGFSDGALEEIVAFTTTTNTRSQAVMMRLGMVHDPSGDFDHPGLPARSPLRRHVLFRVTASQLAPTVTS